MPSVDYAPAPQAVAGIAGATAQNTIIAAAPSVFSTPFGVGGPEVLGITGALNVVGQWIKMHDWFDQNKWLIPLLVVIALAIAVAMWHDNIPKAVLNAAMAVDNAIKNYGALKGVGVLQAGTDVVKGA